jgi:hypothetical protein
MADLDDLHDPPLVVYRIDDAVGALPDAIALFFSGELLAAVRAWRTGEALDSRDDANTYRARLDSLELL